jgi:hypothetical protein
MNNIKDKLSNEKHNHLKLKRKINNKIKERK